MTQPTDPPTRWERDNPVAPRERVNIVYRMAIMDEEVELPLKVLVMGDFTGRAEHEQLENRRAVPVNKETFDAVMKQERLTLEIEVPNRVAPLMAGDTVPLRLAFPTLQGMTPEGIARQVPELRALLELRFALSLIKVPLGGIPAFRKKIEASVRNPVSAARLRREIGLREPDEGHVERGSQATLAQVPAAPVAIEEGLCNSPELGVLLTVASNPAATPRMIERLSARANDDTALRSLLADEVATEERERDIRERLLTVVPEWLHPGEGTAQRR